MMVKQREIGSNILLLFSFLSPLELSYDCYRQSVIWKCGTVYSHNNLTAMETEFSLLSARNQHCPGLPLCSYPTLGIMCNGYKNALVNITLNSNAKYYSA